ncbi:enterobactin exporter EntS [Acidipropionibacterium jensenii]|uniref:Enterobactin exporter EntS n=2 Tax=Acidipropionibacterium jensenii TaxID=1749 RepID=A0A448P173_9ACTN|nr:enterobactin exporter EntS [Acidipropionibacterium jensenii]
MRTMFASLSIPNYRIFFVGTLMANLGQWIARTSQAWLVLTILTHGNATALGWVTAINFLPILLITPWAGALADRFPKRRIMVMAQIVLLIDAAILALLVLTGHAQLWMVFLFAGLDGIASAFYSPAMQAFVSELVPLSQLPNAIGLNSASFNGARLLGPGLAGLLVAAFGVGWVMTINVGLFVLFIASLIMLRSEQLHPAPIAVEKATVRDGIRYVRARPDLMLLLFIGFMMGTFGFNFNISDAVMATAAFGKGSGEFGLLGSVMGLGSIIGALQAARRRPRLRYIELALVVYTVSMTAATFAPTYPVFAAIMAPIGWGAVSTLIIANTMVQMSVSPQMRGRVMSFWAMLVMGGTPLVSPVVGWLGDAVGPRATVAFGAISLGITFVVITAVVMRSDRIRVHLDPSKGAPWLRMVRGQVTVDLDRHVR